MRFRIFVPGGLASSHDLAHLCTFLPVGLGVSERQEWVAEVPDSQAEAVCQALNQAHVAWARTGIEAYNVMSSAPALGSGPSTPWLTDDAFREALGGFPFSPRLRVGVTDPRQGLVPRWAHDLNFTASDLPERWRLDIRLGDKLHAWPVLWGTEELARAAFFLEDEIVALENTNPETLEEAMAVRFPGPRPLDRPRPTPPSPRLPVHEGLQRLAGGGYSLGLWRPDGVFSLDFLAEIASLCRSTGLGLLALTPWQSILIKGIRETDRELWESLLTRHGVNTRHAAQEAGWQTSDDAKTRRLQRRLVRRLVRNDVRTYGLTFSLGSTLSSVGTTAVTLEKKGLRWHLRRAAVPCSEALSLGSPLKVWPWNLGRSLEQVCRSFAEASAPPPPAPQTAPTQPECPDCGNRYDERWGDPLSGVAPGLPFQKLPDSWTCPVCGTPGSNFLVTSPGM